MAYPIASLPNGQWRMSDGSVVWPQTFAPSSGNTNSPGQVLGDSTTNTAPSDNGQQTQNNPAPDPFAQLKGDISSGWDNYIAGLDEQLSSLSGQKSSQEQIAQNQFQEGSNTLGLQKDQGLQALDAEKQKTQKNQEKTLRDLSANISNVMAAGNIKLGSIGAGDSSAANQYSYALTKLASKGRSDIMMNTANILADINRRKENVVQIFNTEYNNLKLELNSQIQAIGQWFSNAQQVIKQQKNTAGLSKSQDLQNLSKDLLNTAIAAIEKVKDNASEQQNVLTKWANSLLGNISQTTNQIQAQSNTNYALPQNQKLAGTPQVGGGNPKAFTYGGGGIFGKDELYPNTLAPGLFGNA